MLAIRAVVFVVGFVVVAAVIGSAIRTVVLPRGIPSLLGRAVFRAMRGVLLLRVGPRASYERVDHVMALYAPLTLMLLVAVWEGLAMVGYAAMFWATGACSPGFCLEISGSSLLTLGVAKAEGPLPAFLMISEAGVGLLVLALLITFLPSLYSAFSRREALVNLLEIRAGSPPSALEMISRFHRIHGLDKLEEVWPRWEQWFAEVEESHTSYPPLVFFRSPQPRHSWVTAAGAVLDAAALRQSALDLPHDPEADLCIRSGYLALRRIAGFFGIPFKPDVTPEDPISVSREEFQEAWDVFESAGIALKPDVEKAWRDFKGWRVNYDSVLLGLAGFTQAPAAPWSSDRAHLAFKFNRTGGRPVPIVPD